MRSRLISKCLTGLLLVVFAIGITPKIYLHNIFASHIDKRSATDCGSLQVAAASYSCDVDNLVAETNFIYHIPSAINKIFSFSGIPYLVKDILYSATCNIYSAFRGPPVLA